MNCINCEKPLLLMPLDHCAAYVDYVERYVDCPHCDHTNVIRYNKATTVCTYQKVRKQNGDKS